MVQMLWDQRNVSVLPNIVPNARRHRNRKIVRTARTDVDRIPFHTHLDIDAMLRAMPKPIPVVLPIVHPGVLTNRRRVVLESLPVEKPQLAQTNVAAPKPRQTA